MRIGRIGPEPRKWPTGLVQLAPDSIGHHQKRVELAYRTGDRAPLLYAYMGLGDALAKSGAIDKATAVYGRVIEHDPGNAQGRRRVGAARLQNRPAKLQACCRGSRRPTPLPGATASAAQGSPRLHRPPRRAARPAGQVGAGSGSLRRAPGRSARAGAGTRASSILAPWCGTMTTSEIPACG